MLRVVVFCNMVETLRIWRHENVGNLVRKPDLILGSAVILQKFDWVRVVPRPSVDPHALMYTSQRAWPESLVVISPNTLKTDVEINFQRSRTLASNVCGLTGDGHAAYFECCLYLVLSARKT